MSEQFQEMNVADFFYKNKDLVGFDSPHKATYMIVRELVENSLDACDGHGIAPKIRVVLSKVEGAGPGQERYHIKIVDNGIGVPLEAVPYAFGKVLFGSKYSMRQNRGTFGLGGKMSLLYGQITANSHVIITTSQGGGKIYSFELSTDIRTNTPLIHKKEETENKSRFRGVKIEFDFEGDYGKARDKVLEYFYETAMILPYAQLVYIDPNGTLLFYPAITEKMPPPPTDTLPHPHGVDLEMLKRMIATNPHTSLQVFLSKNFQRVGERTARAFLRANGFDVHAEVKELNAKQLSKLVTALREYQDFLPPDPSCLSPIGEELLEKGITTMLSPQHVVVTTRPPKAYEGHPFIVEVGMAYGGEIAPPESPGKIQLYRFANKIPLLYDEGSDVVMSVIRDINWSQYKIKLDEAPIAFITHICSTKVPYKTAGKEYVAARPEVEREVSLAIKQAARELRVKLSRMEKAEYKERRTEVLRKYLAMIAEFSTALAERQGSIDLESLLREAPKRRSSGRRIKELQAEMSSDPPPDGQRDTSGAGTAEARSRRRELPGDRGGKRS
ncbi:MAG: DNA topoisomerase VI subunit B [Thermoprotei archaeon]|nr:DNA topoisomerase VI subunit B [TACK group archaeon]